jgi:hypothetical protein
VGLAIFAYKHHADAHAELGRGGPEHLAKGVEEEMLPPDVQLHRLLVGHPIRPYLHSPAPGEDGPRPLGQGEGGHLDGLEDHPEAAGVDQHGEEHLALTLLRLDGCAKLLIGEEHLALRLRHGEVGRGAPGDILGGPVAEASPHEDPHQRDIPRHAREVQGAPPVRVQDGGRGPELEEDLEQGGGSQRWHIGVSWVGLATMSVQVRGGFGGIEMPDEGRSRNMLEWGLESGPARC